MSQRKNQKSTTNGDTASSQHVIDTDKLHALQQYQDTEGHFSLVRCAARICPSCRICTDIAFFLFLFVGISAWLTSSL